jgi:hypothetical protein
MLSSRHSLLTLLAVLALWGTATAQVPYRGYTPPGGATLPYQLEYFRPQSGVLDQYNQFVAPRENLANQLRGMAQQQNADFRAVEQQLRESDRIRESQAAATGVAGGFMNYSHYYGGLRGGAGGNRASRPPRTISLPSASLPSIGGGIGMGSGS